MFGWGTLWCLTAQEGSLVGEYLFPDWGRKEVPFSILVTNADLSSFFCALLTLLLATSLYLSLHSTYLSPMSAKC